MEQAMVYVAPVRFASGMQNKIQEALAMEVPVVTTSIVAEGVKTEDGEEPPLYVADEPQTLAEKVVQLLQQADERARLSHEERRPHQRPETAWASRRDVRAHTGDSGRDTENLGECRRQPGNLQKR